MTNKPLTLIALTLLGVCLGYFMVILLPAIFATWLGQEIEMRRPSEIPHKCDPENLSPIWDSDKWINEIQERILK